MGGQDHKTDAFNNAAQFFADSKNKVSSLNHIAAVVTKEYIQPSGVALKLYNLAYKQKDSVVRL